MKFVLTLALLVCHGVLGATHLPAETPAESSSAHTSHMSHDGHDDGGVLSAHHEAEVAYFAVVFWLAVALAISLLRYGVKRSPAGFVARSLVNVRWDIHSVPLPRGPTLSSLQVFRL